MTPLEAWRHWLEDCESPDSYINFAFYAMVAAACERRIWLTTSKGTLYPNLYTVLVGTPGVGKGQVIKPVLEVLREFKKADAPEAKLFGLSDEVQGMAKLFNLDPKGMRIPVGPESTTLASLLAELPKLTRPLIANGRTSCYTAIFLGLEELTTFVNGEDTVRDFLLAAYDCGHFRRTLKCSDSITIINMCLNFLAGTTPDTFREVMGDRALTDGFTSRTWFIYAEQRRKYCMNDKPRDTMLAARGQVVRFIGKVIDLSGEVLLDEEAYAHLKYWYENVFPFVRANTNTLLDNYYTRKNLHVLKLALILKVIEAPDLSPVRKHHVEQAISILNDEELNMHRALSAKNRNELAPIMRKVLLWLMKEKSAKPGRILEQFYAEIQGVPEALQIIQDGCRQGKMQINKDLTVSLKGAAGELANPISIASLNDPNHDCWKV